MAAACPAFHMIRRVRAGEMFASPGSTAERRASPRRRQENSGTIVSAALLTRFLADRSLDLGE